MFCNKSCSKWVIIFCILLSSAIIIIVIKSFSYIQIMPTLSINKIDFNNIPFEMYSAIKSGNMPEYWGLISIQDKKIHNYLNSEHSDRIQKFHVILNGVRRCMKVPGSIPEGHYLIATSDGVHNDYPAPFLAFASDKELVDNNKVVLIPDFEAIAGYDKLFSELSTGISNYPWKKKQSKILWRGSSTGYHKIVDKNSSFPRKRFIEYTKNLFYVDAGFTRYYKLNSPIIKELKESQGIKNHIAPSEALAFKYLIDLDGNSCSFSRMAWILSSNSLLFKHTTTKIQWYYDKLIPYVHYLPISFNFENLYTQYLWAENSQDAVINMTKNARVLASKIFSRQSIDDAIRNGFTRYNMIISKN